ncbi:MAG TPA: SprT family zinc-dependent metalloprotease [Candidatus Saccharimonadales bacterium]|nr:SprT family zinc-dependent metalloprotease [Candidatus Saccharimonadales bacterium]
MKRAGSRSLRLSVTPTGVRVSMPRWTSFHDGQAFAEGHAAWIKLQLAKRPLQLLVQGQKIGKMHHLRFEHALDSQSATGRVTSTEIIIRLASGETVTDTEVQARAYQTCIRALKREAERLLKPRLQSLADKHGMSFTGFAVKQLKRRWGSCDSHRAITLNLFLMELPWEFIDYVLLHELAHTLEMNHGPDFWEELLAMEPRARELSRQLRKHQPTIGAWQPS